MRSKSDGKVRIFLIYIFIILLGSAFVISNINIPRVELGLPRVPKWDTSLSAWAYRIGVKFTPNYTTPAKIINVSIDFLEQMEKIGVASHYNKDGQLNQTGLIGEYIFRYDANDTSGYGNNGTVSGATLVEGRIGKGYDFDGSNDWINVSELNRFDTVALWFHNDSGWWHVVNTTSNLYLNGTSCTGSCSVFPFWNKTGSVAIGKTSNIAYFDGIIDEVLVWNRSLTSGEISAYYNYTARQPFWDNSSIRITEHRFGGGIRNSNISHYLLKRGGVVI